MLFVDEQQLDLPVMANLGYPAQEEQTEVALGKTNWMWKTYENLPCIYHVSRETMACPFLY